jgi:anthranilate synthase component 1
MTDATVRPLVRRLPLEPDPLALYRALGDAPDTFLLESADRITGSGERSLIGIGTAIHIAARRGETVATALSPNGRAALDWLASRLPNGVAAGDQLRVPVDRSSGPAFEEHTRFRRPSPLDVVRTLAFEPTLASRPNPWCHLLAGVIGFDAIDYFEDLPAGPEDPLDRPLVEFWLPDRLAVIDHRLHATWLITTAWGGPGADARVHDAGRALERLIDGARQLPNEPLSETSSPAGDFALAEVDQDDDTFAATVRDLLEQIRRGEVYQIVPSRTFSLPCDDPLLAYRHLRRHNPSPYLFLLRGRERTLFGASPETCLRVDGSTRRATLVPIAGTAPRGVDAQGLPDPEADRRNEVALRGDPKEQAEHLMLVDLARNDLARICVPGSRQVTRLLAVERYAHVMHLVSEVSGTLRPEVDSLEAFAATMPMGTLVGAPKVRAAELLRGTEPSRRGSYGGGVGYLRDDGTLETAIVIRSAEVRDGLAQVRAGAGVVLDSDPAAEAAETTRKARAVLEAIAATQPAAVSNA